MKGKYLKGRLKWILPAFLLIMMCGFRYYELNANYPSPKEISAAMGEDVEVNGCVWRLESWEWKDVSEVKELLPNYILAYTEDGEEYPAEKERGAYAAIKITNESEETQEIDLTEVALESGAWHNQWDDIVFEALNGDEKLIFQLDSGESQEVIIPVILYAFEFTKSQWKTVEDREFRIVISNYPEKIYLVCNVDA